MPNTATGVARITSMRALLFVGALVAAVIGLSVPTGSQAAPLNPNALYVVPNGSAGAAGTIAAPTSLASAITRITAGGTVYLRGGTYKMSTTVAIDPGNVGTARAMKGLFAYPGETPVLNFAAMTEDPANRGLAVNGSYWHVYGLVVERAGDNGIFVGGHHNVIERTITRFNRDSGLQISRAAAGAAKADWPSYNLILSTESHDNADSDGEDADGFAAKLTVGEGNVFRYAVSHNNIDDGWDLYTKTETGPIGAVTIEDSLSYNNGTLSNGGQAGAGDRNGFKLGGEDIKVNHVIRRTIAYGNGKHGYTYNRNLGAITMANNVSINSGERNFSFDGGNSVFTGNVSCRTAGGAEDKIVGSADAGNSFWAGGNSARCASYAGKLGWRFDDSGKLVVTFGGTQVQGPAASPSSAAATSKPTTPTTPTRTTTPTRVTPNSSTATSASPPTPAAAKPATAGGAVSDDFEDGNAAGWTTSGGAWTVGNDGSRAYRQATTSGYTHSLTGSSSWSAQQVQARVKAVQFVGSGQYVAVLARAKNASNYYALTLRDANRVELRKVTAGRSTVLASASFDVATNVWYTLRLDASGSSLTGYVGGKLLVSATDTALAGGGAGLSTFNASASFDDVRVTVPGGSSPVAAPASPRSSPSPTAAVSAPATRPTTATPRTILTPTATKPAVGGAANPGGRPDFSLVGYGAGTTGGAGGATVTVNTLGALQTAAGSSGRLTIQINGTISGNASVDIASNKTLVGVGTAGKLVGIELSMTDGVSNIIIRNLSISKVVAPRDHIHIQGPDTRNIWIDHNEIFSALVDDIDYYDGALDITHGVENVTVSWNYIHDTNKASLIGHSDDNSADRGTFHVTYHHNLFTNLNSRGPSIRFGTLHAYNNFYLDFVKADTAISSRMGACARVENNVFSGVAKPVLTTQTGTGSEAGGVQLLGNDFGGGTVETSPTCAVTPPYSYRADSTASVPSIVSTWAGVGKI